MPTSTTRRTLYAGYVKQVNLLNEELAAFLCAGAEPKPPSGSGLRLE